MSCSTLVTFIRLIFTADRYFRDERPDAVVLIDYPGLHWWIARRARLEAYRSFTLCRRRSGRGAAGGSRRCASTLTAFCAVFRSSPRGIKRGDIAMRPMSAIPISTSWPIDLWMRISWPVSGAWTASSWRSFPARAPRNSCSNLPDMIRAATKLARGRGDVRFAVACLHQRHKALAEKVIAQCTGQEGSAPLPIEVHAGRTAELIRLGGLPGPCRARSGSS